MRCVRQDDQLIIKDQSRSSVTGVLMMVSSVAMLVLVFCTIPLMWEVWFLYLLVFVVWGTMLALGVYAFLSGFRHEVVISPEGVLEKCPLLPSKQRNLAWSEIKDWGYTYTVPDFKFLLSYKCVRYRLYFSDHLLGVTGPNRVKRMTKHGIFVQFGWYNCVDKDVYRTVLPFCAQFTEVKPFRAPEIHF